MGLVKVTGRGDTVLYANRAAAYIGLEKWIKAANDGRLSAECDPDNWKAYWRAAVSLMAMVPKRFRTKSAIDCLEKCLACTTITPEATAEAEALLAKAHARY